MRMRRGRSQTWSQVPRFPTACELRFIMKKFQGERASRIQTRSDRKTSQSQQPPLPSPLTRLLSALSPSLSGLWLVHLYSVFSLEASMGLWVPLAHVCCPGGNVSVFERQRRCDQSEWNPKAQQERNGDRLSPYHVKTKNTRGYAVLCFCGCLDFGNWLFLRCSLQALAGGHRSVGRKEGSMSARLQYRDGPATPLLNSNSCLLPRATKWLYEVFPKLHYQKFNNSKSTLLLLMCVSVTNGSRWNAPQDEQPSMPHKCLSFGLREALRKNI